MARIGAKDRGPSEYSIRILPPAQRRVKYKTDQPMPVVAMMAIRALMAVVATWLWVLSWLCWPGGAHGHDGLCGIVAIVAIRGSVRVNRDRSFMIAMMAITMVRFFCLCVAIQHRSIRQSVTENHCACQVTRTDVYVICAMVATMATTGCGW